ncbi:MAG: nitroreductase family protein [Actinomycetota bacterium]|nr:nitroreductase family protein [Actinomycetota bacterium]
MEFTTVVRRRRMVRSFEQRPVPEANLRRILDAGRRGPSAGFSQGVDFLVLRTPGEVASFWAATDEPDWPWKPADLAAGPPVIVLPLSNKQAYLERYSRPDKAGAGMQVEEGWPVPYWDVDAAMAAMLMLLAAVDEGLGGWLFGIFHGERGLLARLGVPPGVRPIGALGFGYPAPEERRPGSSRRLQRRALDEVAHWGRW